MKLLITGTELETEFARLMQNYSKFYWATAWAGLPVNLLKQLEVHTKKIERLVVGIHFYQTHPNFIEKFLHHAGVKFIKQPEGTFHPKLYLFLNNKKQWELIVGSSNFTHHAFSRNSEVSVLTNPEDSHAEEMLKNALTVVNRSWTGAKPFTEAELDMYRKVWRNQKSKIGSLSGRYGGSRERSKPPHQAHITNMTWEEFVEGVKNEHKHGVMNRIGVLSVSRKLFEKAKHFNQLPEDERKFIAGIPNRLQVEVGVDWGYFGSMMGAGVFKNRVITNDDGISKALDQIPLNGQITRSQYDSYIVYYARALPGSHIATATRLLAMKRPDVFVCLDSKNRSNLCKDFGIKQSGMTYDRYWTDVVEGIMNAEWWLNPQPKNQQEELIRDARAAFLDALYYEE